MLQKIFRFFFKKSHLTYTLLGMVFLIWIIFLDTHSLLIHNELNQEIKELNAQKKQLQKEIDKDSTAIEQLQNLDSLEKFARENYLHKKEGEKIYLIEFKDSISE
ncbi:MAG: septum formation initiator family protein [Flavobacteriales bacterium]|jgi:cell division protein DivIC|nr:septum formation initiator family protein [Flavobacteriales bacterium]